LRGGGASNGEKNTTKTRQRKVVNRGGESRGTALRGGRKRTRFGFHLNRTTVIEEEGPPEIGLGECITPSQIHVTCARHSWGNEKRKVVKKSKNNACFFRVERRKRGICTPSVGGQGAIQAPQPDNSTETSP